MCVNLIACFDNDNDNEKHFFSKNNVHVINVKSVNKSTLGKET